MFAGVALHGLDLASFGPDHVHFVKVEDTKILVDGEIHKWVVLQRNVDAVLKATVKLVEVHIEPENVCSDHQQDDVVVLFDQVVHEVLILDIFRSARMRLLLLPLLVGFITRELVALCLQFMGQYSRQVLEGFEVRINVITAPHQF